MRSPLLPNEISHQVSIESVKMAFIWGSGLSREADAHYLVCWECQQNFKSMELDATDANDELIYLNDTDVWGSKELQIALKFSQNQIAQHRLVIAYMISEQPEKIDQIKDWLDIISRLIDDTDYCVVEQAIRASVALLGTAVCQSESEPDAFQRLLDISRVIFEDKQGTPELSVCIAFNEAVNTFVQNQGQLLSIGQRSALASTAAYYTSRGYLGVQSCGIPNIGTICASGPLNDSARDTVQQLLEWATTHTSWLIRWYAVDAWKAFGGDRSVAWLVQLSLDPDQDVRSHTLELSVKQ